MNGTEDHYQQLDLQGPCHVQHPIQQVPTMEFQLKMLLLNHLNNLYQQSVEAMVDSTGYVRYVYCYHRRRLPSVQTFLCHRHRRDLRHYHDEQLDGLYVRE